MGDFYFYLVTLVEKFVLSDVWGNKSNHFFGTKMNFKQNEDSLKFTYYMRMLIAPKVNFFLP